MMKTSQKGINLIKQFEGLRLEAYKCDPSEKLYTIGYGHYGVAANLVITQEHADALLINDIRKYEIKVNKYLSTYHFNQNQFDALVSFAYNIGSIDQLTANGTRTISEISTKMLQYNKCSGKALAGLTKRRKAEQKLFNTPVSEKTLLAIAQEVINGKWGNGEMRKKKLTEAGYDYATIQALVNELLKK